MSELIPEGATHYHEKDDEWLPHYIKVYVANVLADEEVKVWVDFGDNKGHWSDLPVWDKDNKDKYIKLDKK